MMWLWLMACSGPVSDDTGSPPTDTASTASEDCDASWNSWAAGFFTTYCTSCHHPESTNRYGAPDGVDFHSRDATLLRLDRVRARVLASQDMPLGGGVLNEDLVRLDAWLTCAGAGL